LRRGKLFPCHFFLGPSSSREAPETDTQLFSTPCIRKVIRSSVIPEETGGCGCTLTDIPILGGEISAQSYGTPDWSVFKLMPLDGDITIFSRAWNGKGSDSSFDWKEGMQYLRTNEYDPANDLRTGEGCQITLRDPNEEEEKIALYSPCDKEEIEAYLGKLFHIQAWKKIVLRDIEPGIYDRATEIVQSNLTIETILSSGTTSASFDFEM
jgi:hypothetical protein